MIQFYDLVIIGGGSAGLTAADFAIQFGARVAIVDANRIGGDCTWTGCVPSKTLLKAGQSRSPNAYCGSLWAESCRYRRLT